MRYLLVMGFVCDVYRREPLARFYFDDRLIDEFLIQHYTEKDIIRTKHILDPKAGIEYQKCMPPLRFYELEINKVSRYANIRIEITNDDNNYMNGFMSKNTLLKFKVLSLLPKDRSVYDWFARQRRYINPGRWTSKKCNKLLDLTRYVEWRSNNGEKIIHNLFQHIYIGASGNLHCELIKKYGVLMPKSFTQNTPYLYTVSKIHDTLYDKYEQYANK